MTNPGPPPPNLGGRRSASGALPSAQTGNRPPVQAGSAPGRAAARPAAVQFAACVATLIFVVISLRLGDLKLMGILSTGRDINFNTIGYVVGCFVSILALYLFLSQDRRARDTLRYTDWPGPFGARTMAVTLTLASWLVGGLHLWFWAQDLTRP